jgi:hypothetical protein
MVPDRAVCKETGEEVEVDGFDLAAKKVCALLCFNFLFSLNG